MSATRKVTDRLLRNEIRMLGEVLGEVLREQAGGKAFDLVEKVRGLAKARRSGDSKAESQLIRTIARQKESDFFSLIQALSVFFDLANLAEDRHRVRVLRKREGARDSMRAESLESQVAHLRRAGVTADRMQKILDRLSLELVFTAHPTEAKRRSVREKIRDLRRHLAELDQHQAANAPANRSDAIMDRIRADLTGLWQTDFVRFRRPTVLEELDRSLFFAGNLWWVTPQLYRDLSDALARHYPDNAFTIPPYLRFGTWIGGDRDGNPNVTADVTKRALQTLRREALTRHIEQARLCRRNLSMSSRKTSVSSALLAEIDRAVAEQPELAGQISHLSEHEPYRRWLRIVQWRLERTLNGDDHGRSDSNGAYNDSNDFVNDLDLMRRSLYENRGSAVADAHLNGWICQARVFGFHLMRMDIRQESTWHHEVLAELLDHLGVCSNYAELDEAGRQRVLSQSMPRRSSVGAAIGDESTLSDQAREAIALYRLLAASCTATASSGIGAYIISMTHQPSDVLAVLWLGRWAASESQGRQFPDDRLPIPIAPLFETIDDLHRAPQTVASMLSHPVYADHVAATGGKQVVMIGYSDSTKDGGYLAACWNLHEAQMAICEAAEQAAGVDVVFFHGRGGSLGRGGGPAARSILSLPPDTLGAGLRITEQGEVLSERYDDPDIAHRHLEQVSSALLYRTAKDSEHEGDGRHARDKRSNRKRIKSGNSHSAVPGDGDDRYPAVMSELAAASRQTYRELVDQPGFMAYFEQATPITQIEQLPIGSRPARRKQDRSLATLRAIPWVFSWTQCRHLIPAWYGLGSSLEAYMKSHRRARELFRRFYAEQPSFRAMIDNAALALAKADMGIASRHAMLVEDRDVRKRIWSAITDEYEKSRSVVLSILGRRELLTDIPWLRRSIEVRNPYVDPLNLIQVELFRRLRIKEDGRADNSESEEIAELIRLTIQGIAGGLRTTG